MPSWRSETNPFWACAFRKSFKNGTSVHTDINHAWLQNNAKLFVQAITEVQSKECHSSIFYFAFRKCLKNLWKGFIRISCLICGNCTGIDKGCQVVILALLMTKLKSRGKIVKMQRVGRIFYLRNKGGGNRKKKNSRAFSYSQQNKNVILHKGRRGHFEEKISIRGCKNLFNLMLKEITRGRCVDKRTGVDNQIFRQIKLTNRDCFNIFNLEKALSPISECFDKPQKAEFKCKFCSVISSTLIVVNMGKVLCFVCR